MWSVLGFYALSTIACVNGLTWEDRPTRGDGRIKGRLKSDVKPERGNIWTGV